MLSFLKKELIHTTVWEFLVAQTVLDPKAVPCSSELSWQPALLELLTSLCCHSAFSFRSTRVYPGLWVQLELLPACGALQGRKINAGDVDLSQRRSWLWASRRHTLETSALGGASGGSGQPLVSSPRQAALPPENMDSPSVSAFCFPSIQPAPCPCFILWSLILRCLEWSLTSGCK